jgi:bleomycin hydrolase
VFGTNSLFESDLIKKYDTKLDLSEMFIARYAYIDKLKTWLATKGKTYFAGGGQFHDVIRVVNNYGMVPENAYRGIPKSRRSHDHTKLDTAMHQLGRKFLRAGKTILSSTDVQQVNDTLDKYLGKVPATFTYQMEQYTPRSFAQKLIHFENDYVELMSFADQPLYKKCLLDDKFNWAGDSLYNIPLSDMQILIDSALANGWSVGWEGDVTEPGFGIFSGFAMINDSIYNYDEERLKNYKTEATERDHMFHLCRYWQRRSWSEMVSFKKFMGLMANNNGYLFMSENYLKLKTVILMVNKAALPKYLKEKLNISQ